MASLWQDVRYGVRLLRQSPVFAVVSVASLGVALAASLALYSALNAVVFRPLPGRGTMDLHAIALRGTDGRRSNGLSLADVRDFTASSGTFAATCATTNTLANLTTGTVTHALAGAVMTGGCFEAIRLQPHVGRLLNQGDDLPPSDASPIVISHSFWRRALGGAPEAVGQSVRLNGRAARIVGVAEPGFFGLSLDRGADFWAPAALAPDLLARDVLTARDDRRFRVYVRLAPGVTAAAESARLSALAARLGEADPEGGKGVGGSSGAVIVEREIDARLATSGGILELALLVLAAIAGIIAVASVNLATIAIARGARRTRELSVRLTLGASRWRLLRQLGTESLLLSAAGAALGMLLLAIVMEASHAFRPTAVPAFDVRLDWRVAGVALLLALAAPVLFGVVPGFHVLRLAIADGLRGVGRRQRGLPGPREALLAGQVALSFGLLIMAAVLARSLTREVTPVAPAPQVLVLPVDLNTTASSDDEALRVAARVLEAVTADPAVERASSSAVVPLTGSFLTTGGWASADRQGPLLSLDANVVAPGYFDLVGTRRLAGRDFDARDHAYAPGVAIVSESLARRLWQTTAGVGRSIHLERGVREVVGVVADVPYRSTTAATHPVVYVPAAQSARTRFILHARAGEPAAASVALTQRIHEVDARIVVGSGQRLADFLDAANAAARVTQQVGVAAGLVELALVLLATWGLVAYAVERRSAEMAVRRALGATEGAVVRLHMRPVLILLAGGAAVGALGGAVAVRALHASFNGLAPLQFGDGVPVALAMAAVVLTGTWLPARRATRVEPAAALAQRWTGS